MDIAAFKQKLGEVSHVLPISAAALDVYEMTKNTNGTCRKSPRPCSATPP